MVFQTLRTPPCPSSEYWVLLSTVQLTTFTVVAPANPDWMPRCVPVTTQLVMLAKPYWR